MASCKPEVFRSQGGQGPRRATLPGPLARSLEVNLRAIDPDAFRQRLSGGVQDLSEPVVVELLLDWLYSFLTVEEQDRLTGWRLGVSL